MAKRPIGDRNNDRLAGTIVAFQQPLGMIGIRCAAEIIRYERNRAFVAATITKGVLKDEHISAIMLHRN